MSYSEKLRDPRWQKKRLLVLERDAFTCQCCKDKDMELHVHHNKYHGDPWEAPLSELVTYCKVCHLVYEMVKKYKGSTVRFVLRRKTWVLGLWAVTTLLNYAKDDGAIIPGVLFAVFEKDTLEYQMLCSFESLFDVVEIFSKELMFKKDPVQDEDELEWIKGGTGNESKWRPMPTEVKDDLPFD